MNAIENTTLVEKFRTGNFDWNQIEIDEVDKGTGYPEYVDSYIISAYYGEKELTEKELDILNDKYYDIIQELIFNIEY